LIEPLNHALATVVARFYRRVSDTLIRKHLLHTLIQELAPVIGLQEHARRPILTLFYEGVYSAGATCLLSFDWSWYAYANLEFTFITHSTTVFFTNIRSA
jgi:hypothetical protein